MLCGLLEIIFSSITFLALHVTNSNSFPKPLSEKEEKTYLNQLLQGNRKARNKLIEHNLRLVAHIVKKYYTSNVDQDDLVSIGTIGLIKAVDSFNCDKGIKLSSYAARCIENEILMFFRNSKKSAQDISINEPIDTDKDGNALTLIDVLAIEDTMVDNIDTKIKAEKIKKYIELYLNDREKKIIKLRYGINGKIPLTQREVALNMNISRSYVSRIEKKAIDTLKSKINTLGI